MTDPTTPDPQVMNIHRNLPEGDILVFLTGREERWTTHPLSGMNHRRPWNTEHVEIWGFCIIQYIQSTTYIYTVYIYIFKKI